MLEVGAHGAGQDDGLEVPTFAGELGHRVAVGDPGDFLIENRPLVEFFGDVVRSGADELHTSVVRLSVRVGADECGKERVMDVDDSRPVCIHDPWGQDLHVTSQHDEVDVERGECVEKPGLLIVLASRGHRKVVVGNSHVFDHVGVVGVIVDDADDVGWKFTTPPSSQEIEQAVGLLARQKSDSRTYVAESEVDRHVESSGNGGESGQDVVTSDIETLEFELDTLKEHVLDVVGVLFGVDDVAIVRGDEFGH